MHVSVKIFRGDSPTVSYRNCWLESVRLDLTEPRKGSSYAKDCILLNFRLGVTDARVRIQTGFSTRKRLEEVSPKCAFVGFAYLVKSRAESTDATGDLRRKHFGRQRLLDDLVPLWIPGCPTELDLFHIDRGRRGWFGALRTHCCGYSHEKYETHDERCLQRRDTHVDRASATNRCFTCHRSRGCPAGSD